MLKGFNKGFTLIELVIVIVILGILAAIVVPKYEDLQTRATDAAKEGVEGAVKSAYAIAIAKKQGTPTLTEIVDQISGTDATVGTSGVNVEIAGTPYVVPTYSDASCSTAAGAAVEVLCIGDIQP